MKNLFKKYLIPHKENDYNPHLFKEATTAVLLILILTLFGVAVSSRMVIVSSDLTALVLPRVLVDYTNEGRAAQNYRQLAVNTTLEKAAQLKANDMAEKGYFAHKSPEGRTPWYWFGEAGYDFSYAGENLAVNFSDSVDVNTAWMNSPGHRANILNGNFSEIGIATAEGFYQGRRTTFVVQLFGRPAATTGAVSVKPTTKEVPPKIVVVIPISTSASVLSESVGSEVLSENGTSELFISIEKKSAEISEVGTESTQYSNILEKIAMSPTKTLSFAYMFIALLIIVGLISLFFVEIRNHKPRAVAVTVGLLIIIAGLFYIYKTIIFEVVQVV